MVLAMVLAMVLSLQTKELEGPDQTGFFLNCLLRATWIGKGTQKTKLVGLSIQVGGPQGLKRGTEKTGCFVQLRLENRTFADTHISVSTTAGALIVSGLKTHLFPRTNRVPPGLAAACRLAIAVPSAFRVVASIPHRECLTEEELSWHACTNQGKCIIYDTQRDAC